MLRKLYTKIYVITWVLSNYKFIFCLVGLSPELWPTSSPYLTPFGFFFWDHVKNTVYSVKIQNFDHLRQWVADAVASKMPDIFQRTSDEIDYLLDICRGYHQWYTYWNILRYQKPLFSSRLINMEFFLPAVITWCEWWYMIFVNVSSLSQPNYPVL